MPWDRESLSDRHPGGGRYAHTVTGIPPSVPAGRDRKWADRLQTSLSGPFLPALHYENKTILKNHI
jgi:hypothetical protein